MTGNEAAPIRIGILGAARIAPLALDNPANENVEVVVAAEGGDALDPGVAEQEGVARSGSIVAAITAARSLMPDRPDGGGGVGGEASDVAV